MPRNREMWWRASTSVAPPASLTISSECPTDWISMPGRSRLDRDREPLDVARVAELEAQEAVLGVGLIVVRDLVVEIAAEIAHGVGDALGVGQRPRRLGMARAHDQPRLVGLAVEREAGRVGAAVAHGLAHLHERLADRAGLVQQDSGDPAHQATSSGRRTAASSRTVASWASEMWFRTSSRTLAESRAA